MLMLGIIGEYLWRINSEVRDRPQYIIMEEIGFDGAHEKSFVSAKALSNQDDVIAH